MLPSRKSEVGTRNGKGHLTANRWSTPRFYVVHFRVPRWPAFRVGPRGLWATTNRVGDKWSLVLRLRVQAASRNEENAKRWPQKTQKKNTQEAKPCCAAIRVPFFGVFCVFCGHSLRFGLCFRSASARTVLVLFPFAFCAPLFVFVFHGRRQRRRRVTKSHE
jgi:hypothetical protein